MGSCALAELGFCFRQPEFFVHPIRSAFRLKMAQDTPQNPHGGGGGGEIK